MAPPTCWWGAGGHPLVRACTDGVGWWSGDWAGFPLNGGVNKEERTHLYLKPLNPPPPPNLYPSPRTT